MKPKLYFADVLRIAVDFAPRQLWKLFAGIYGQMHNVEDRPTDAYIVIPTETPFLIPSPTRCIILDIPSPLNPDAT